MKTLLRFATLALLLTATLSLSAAPKLLVFSKTAGFRHACIPEGIAAIARLAHREGWDVTFTENAKVFTADQLAAYDAVSFFCTSGDALDEAQMGALKDFIASGRGFAGIHSATDTETGDAWFPTMIGARFRNHPKQQTATVRVHRDGPDADLVAHLGDTWTRFDEWYNFIEPVPADARVLLTVDETTYEGGTMGEWHPMAWTRRVGGGRVFYTALGHTEASYRDPVFLEHLRRGLNWALATTRADAETGWRPLLDRNLSQWESFIGVPHGSLGLPGVPADSDGRNGTPLGLGRDPLGVFRMIEQDGEPVLAVNGQIFAGLTTREEFANYHLRLQFKWGDRKWAPRADKKRDSGLLYHCTGPHGAFWNVWMRCLEFQIMEGDTGDYFGLAGTAATITAVQKEKRWFYDPTAPAQVFLKAPGAPGSYVAHRPGDFERPQGEWDTLDLYVIGRDAVHVVNGQVVNVLRDAAVVEADGSLQPLSSGKIQLQSEAADCYFRRVEIRPITEFPAAIRAALESPAR